MVLLPSCAVPGDVLSSCGVRIPVLVHYAMRLFSRCSLLAHLYLWFERLLSSSGVELPLEVWCSRLLLSRGKVWGLLSSCGVWVSSSLVAVCVLLSSCGWGLLSSCVGGLGVPLELRWGLHSSCGGVAPL